MRSFRHLRVALGSTALVGATLIAPPLVSPAAATPGVVTTFPWTVPTGVEVVQAKLSGGSGGAGADGADDGQGGTPGSGASGGLGTEVQTPLIVAAGAVVSTFLGGNGTSGTNGSPAAGGTSLNNLYNGGNGSGGGGGGGGASVLAVDLDMVMIAAGGGGGGSGAGNDTGTSGGDGGGGGNGGGPYGANGASGRDDQGQPNGGYPGYGATHISPTTVVPGNGGCQNMNSYGIGGNGGCTLASGGAGGGGGYVGGSGGTGGALFHGGGGGGGGSTWMDPTVTSSVAVGYLAAISASASIEFIEFSTTSLSAAAVGTNYSQTVVATLGASTSPTNWTVSPALPSGLTLDASTGVISGMPTAASSASYTVTASVESGGQSSVVLARSSKSFTLTVNAAPSPSPTPTQTSAPAPPTPSPSASTSATARPTSTPTPTTTPAPSTSPTTPIALRQPTIPGFTAPRRIKVPGTTVLVPRTLTTADGQRVTARASVRRTPARARNLPAPSGLGARIVIGKNGRISVVTTGRRPVTVALRLTAPATATTAALVRTNTWKVPARR